MAKCTGGRVLLAALVPWRHIGVNARRLRRCERRRVDWGSAVERGLVLVEWRWRVGLVRVLRWRIRSLGRHGRARLLLGVRVVEGRGRGIVQRVARPRLLPKALLLPRRLGALSKTAQVRFLLVRIRRWVARQRRGIRNRVDAIEEADQ